MSSTLYRKYRPQAFADVIGQDHITQTLQNQVVSGRLAHAYLFCGTRGVGKTTVARLLAKALNCQSRATQSAEPCNKCGSCTAITLGRSLDIIEIDAASNRRIDDVREIREHIPYGPAENAYKIVIIDEVHMLTTEAFNALLKTLEEPPSHVVFVLATTEVHKLPDTITSRCQRYDFRPIPAPILEKRLEKLAAAEDVKIDSDVISDLAHLARGSTRDAESFLGKLISLGDKQINRERASLVLPKFDTALCIQFIKHLIERDATNAIKLINDYVSDGGELSHFHGQVLELMRQVMLYKVSGSGSADFYGSSRVADELKALAGSITQTRSQQFIEKWLAANDSWRDADIAQLPLELVTVELTAGKIEAAPATVDGANNGKSASHKSPEQPKVIVASDSAQLLSLIQERWTDIVAKLRDFNHSLSFILSIAKPSVIEGNTLTILFQYQLHLDRVHDAKVREAIAQALKEIAGVDLSIKGKLEAVPAGGDLLSNVLSTFGGEIVN